MTLRIRDVLPATPRARVVRLDLDGQPFPYQAGQAVLIASHGYERRKPYSIASAPEDAERDGYLELLVGVDAEGAAGPHLRLQRDELGRRRRSGRTFTFPAAPAERRFLFVAGGTGIAPLRAMLRHALHMPHREIGLLYSARTPQEFAFEEEFRSLAREGEIHLRQTVTREAADDWDGTRGRISQADLAPLVHDPETLCFVCGPPALVAEIPKLLGELGVEPGRVRIEEWTDAGRPEEAGTTAYWLRLGSLDLERRLDVLDARHAARDLYGALFLVPRPDDPGHRHDALRGVHVDFQTGDLRVVQQRRLDARRDGRVVDRLADRLAARRNQQRQDDEQRPAATLCAFP